MKNVYDILVNFKKKAYEFYEWDRNDDIEHIKKIPAIRVDDKVIKDFLYGEVKVSKEFLNRIYSKTEVYSNKLIKLIEFSCILFNKEFALAIEFNKEGKIIGKSKLLFDESDDIVCNTNLEVKNDINYEIISSSKDNNKYTRREYKTILMLNNYIEDLLKRNKEDEFRYVYFECFNEDSKDIKKAYEKLKEKINDANHEIIKKLTNLVKVLKK